MKDNTRRSFIKKSSSVVASAALAGGFPSIISSCAISKNSPSNRLNIAAIGTGRISVGYDMPEVWRHRDVHIVSVCDVDADRAREAQRLVDEEYTKQRGKDYKGTKVYTDYRELLLDDDIDAVVISTPDHWHTKIAVDAAMAGKDIFLQKPASLTIKEGRYLSDVIQRTGRIFQIGSQQRSANQFRYAAELVRNGRIGQLKKVYVGLPGDPSGDEEPEMPIPAGLDYDMWLGSTPEVYYTEKRVHPQQGFGRPGWLRCEQFGAGMITGWGSHHIDSAHWGMDTEYTGPIEVWGDAEFPTSGLWDVHGIFTTHAKYANGVEMTVSNELPNGVKFEGTDGWIFVTRGDYKVTASDPVADSSGTKPLEASDPEIIKTPIGADEIHLTVSENHHRNWIDSLFSRKQPIAPVEVAHKSCSACLIHHMAMKLDRRLYWDPENERFKNDAAANAMLSRPQRAEYAVKY